jgi:hypothetical protein
MSFVRAAAVSHSRISIPVSSLRANNNNNLQPTLRVGD